MAKLDPNKILLLLLYILTIAFAVIGIESLIINLTPENLFISVNGQYVGRDFLPFYAAGKQALAGNIKNLYTPLGAYQATQEIVPYISEDKISHWAWPYPPHFLLFILPFATVPYFYALAIWLVISIILPSIALWYIWRVRGLFFLATIINFNVLTCLIMGQNAIILSAIAGIGIASIKNRPKLAGICFAIISVKPHFALLIPLSLMLGKYWHILFYTIISTLFLMLISSLIFGFDIYFIAAQHFSSVSDISFSENTWINSIYSTYRAFLGLGLSKYYAWSAHFIFSAVAIYYLQKIWRNDYKISSKWLVFGIATMICSPFSFAYDAPWILLPTMVLVYERINSKIHTTAIFFLLAAVQIFAFPIFSINSSLSILIIISALFLLFFLAKTENIGLPSKNA